MALLPWLTAAEPALDEPRGPFSGGPDPAAIRRRKLEFTKYFVL
jgi:hypothetical protein